MKVSNEVAQIYKIISTAIDNLFVSRIIRETNYYNLYNIIDCEL